MEDEVIYKEKVNSASPLKKKKKKYGTRERAAPYLHAACLGGILKRFSVSVRSNVVQNAILVKVRVVAELDPNGRTRSHPNRKSLWLVFGGLHLF